MMSIEEIESIMDDTAEAVEKQREIDALLSGQMSAEDEDAALAELDQMIADADEVAEIPDEGLVPQLPEVPSDKIPGVTSGMLCIFQATYPSDS